MYIGIKLFNEDIQYRTIFNVSLLFILPLLLTRLISEYNVILFIFIFFGIIYLYSKNLWKISKINIFIIIVLIIIINQMVLPIHTYLDVFFNQFILDLLISILF